MKHSIMKVLSILMALTMVLGTFGSLAAFAEDCEHANATAVEGSTVAPQCNAYGYTLFKCPDCGETFADDVQAKVPCEPVEIPAKDATCQSNAFTAGFVCKWCEEGLDDEDYPEPTELEDTMLDHNWQIQVIEPTCYTDGKIVRACANEGCDEVDEVLEILDTRGTHHMVYEILEGKKPTCKDPGEARYYCTDCDKEYTGVYVAPSAYLHVQGEFETEADCENDGYTGTYCTVCQTAASVIADFKDGTLTNTADGTATISVNESKWGHAMENITDVAELPAGETVLNAAPTCTEDGFQWKKCTNEGCTKTEKVKVGDKLGHTFENASTAAASTIIIYPTCTNFGKMEKFCSRCQHEVEDETFDTREVLGHGFPDLDAVKEALEEDEDAYVYTPATCEKAGYWTVQCTHKWDDATTAATAADDKIQCTATAEVENPEDPAKGHKNLTFTCPACAAANKACDDCTHADRTYVCDNGKDDATGNADKVLCELHGDAAVFEHDYSKLDKEYGATCVSYAYDRMVCVQPGCAQFQKLVYYVDADGEEQSVMESEWNAMDAADKEDLEVFAKYDATNSKLNPNNHENYEVKSETPSTCTVQGSKFAFCFACELPFTEELPLAPHTEYESKPASDYEATCQKPGFTAEISCSVCETILEPQEPILAPDNHEDDDPVVITKDATCGAGKTTVTFYSCCPDKMVVKTEGTVDKDNHGKYNIITGADGYEYEFDDDIWEVTDYEAPTCTEAGAHEYWTCTVCDEVVIQPCDIQGCKHETIEIAALGHDFDVTEGWDPTCWETGKTEYKKCNACDLEIGGKIIPVHGEETRVTYEPKDATCTEDGIAAKDADEYFEENTWCSICHGAVADDPETKNVDESKVADWVIEAEGHDTITIDGGVEATCTTDGYTVKGCTNENCEYYYVKILAAENEDVLVAPGLVNGALVWGIVDYKKATGHNFEPVGKDADATCTEDGYKNKEVCTVCGEVNPDAEDYEVIPATGHYYNVENADKTITKVEILLDCQHIAEAILHKCAECGETFTLADAEHNWITVTLPETCEKDGAIFDVCTLCDMYKGENGEAVETQEEAAVEVIDEIEGHRYESYVAHLEPTLNEDGWYDYICGNCKETVRETLDKLSDKLYLTFDEEEIYVANGDTVKVTLNYSAVEYKFGAMVLIFDYPFYGDVEFVSADCLVDGVDVTVEYHEEQYNVLVLILNSENYVQDEEGNVVADNATLTGEGALVEMTFALNSFADIYFGSENFYVEDVIDAAGDGLNSNNIVLKNELYVETAFLTGDVNGDEEINTGDLLNMIAMVNGADVNSAADLNKDGVVDIDDVMAMKAFLVSDMDAFAYFAMTDVDFWATYDALVDQYLPILNLQLTMNGAEAMTKDAFMTLTEIFVEEEIGTIPYFVAVVYGVEVFAEDLFDEIAHGIMA